jgi:malate dehydrogenase (oxaloacetate-decarboxylating)(NADP+)
MPLTTTRRAAPVKIQVVPTKPTNSQRDLTMAYSPGVCRAMLTDSRKRR